MIAKKSCVLFFIAAVIVEYVCGGFVEQMKAFPCYFKKYQVKKFYCVNEFFLSFRAHPFQNCHEKVKELGSCRQALHDECLSLASKDTLMYKIYVKVSGKPETHQQLSKNYCQNAGLVSKFIEKRSLNRIGCKVEYLMQKQECIEQFQKKWRHNRSSSLLCREYHEMEKCIDHSMKQYCNKKAISTFEKIGKNLLAQLSVDWNPFCVHHGSE